MAHKHRPLEVDLTHHVTAHAISPILCFDGECVRGTFRQLLSAVVESLPLEIHAYALMDNHLHLLLTARAKDALAHGMRFLLGRHALQLNRSRGRVGPVWHDRYASKLIRDLDHLINAHLYIDSNPWRAGIVGHPRESDRTSFRTLVGDRRERFVSPHEEIAQALGEEPSERQAAYGVLMEDYLVQTGYMGNTSDREHG